MAEHIDQLSEEFLEHRDRFNTQFALAKRARPRLESKNFSDNLRMYVAPLVLSFPKEHRSKALCELYELALELTALELFGSSEAVAFVWEKLLLDGSAMLIQEPGSVVAALTNAAYNLERESKADVQFWSQKMTSSLSLCRSPYEWLGAAQVLAWVSGMAHFRASACELAKELPENLVEVLVPRWDKVREDPWWPRRNGASKIQRVHQVGAFSGFGGTFSVPPEVVAAGGNQFLVSDGREEWLLSCDGFGATLKRVVDFEYEEAASPKISVSESGDITWQGETFSYPELNPVLSFDATGQVLAVTSRLSHKVHVFLLAV